MGSSTKLELEIIRFETSDIVTVSGPWPLENGSEYVVKGSELHQGGYGYYHQSGPYGGLWFIWSPRVAQKGSLVKAPEESSLRGLDQGSLLRKDEGKTSMAMSFR